jgi:hypothetical protein
MRVAAIVIVVCALAVVSASAQVTVVRESDENPVVTIAKSTAWGGLAGLTLGAAVALIADENQDNIVKWFFVGGVFGGFGYGIYHVATREHPSTALLRIDRDGVEWNIPGVAFRPSVGPGSRMATAGVTFLQVSF